ncbi:MAG: DEAD/DEAH box helicase [Phycisphaeraceae bacterium]
MPTFDSTTDPAQDQTTNPQAHHHHDAQPAPEIGAIFDQSVTFRDLGLSDQVLAGIDAKGFEHPTDIQAKLIPPILAGKDVLGQARTGTGKTAAFGLPILERADLDTPQQALILAPTRELATQVASELIELAKGTRVDVVTIVGGESMRTQQKKLSAGAQIVVGTPGRVMDLHGRRELSFDNVRFAVLDEVDRMLDIGFRDDIRKILKNIQGEHQTVFVSATISDEIERLGRTFMKKNAEKITTVQGSLTVEMVDQKYFSVEPWDKRALLLKLLRTEKPDTTVVFCRTKATVRKVAQYLKDKGIVAREIHGDLHQTKRNKVMNSMRGGDVDVLIASDLAARGLDVEHISHVINYDIPEDPEIYIHRIGRTARAGRRGVAWSFVTPEEGQRLTDIEKLAGAHIEHMAYPDFTPGPIPKDVQEEREKQTKRLDKATNPSSRVASANVEEMSEEERNRLFPGGVVPKGPPRKSLGRKFRRRGR